MIVIKNHDCHLLCRPLPGYIVLVGRKHVIQAMTERSYMARFDFKLLKVKIRQKNLQENFVIDCNSESVSFAHFFV